MTDTKKGTILIIEDNVTNLNIAKELFEYAGYETLEAYDADSGLKRLHEQKPSLILLDMLMPGKDGFETGREIKSNPEFKDIPIVAFTALATSEEQEKIMEAGCQGIVTKPLDVQTFVQTIESYLTTTESEI
jgi:CheY-like chemotaxis protein